MKLTIFGATGMVGVKLVQQALLMGHEVNAFGRNVLKTDFMYNKNLRLITGSVFDEQQVSMALQSVDAVLSVLGGAFDGTDNTRSLGMKNIVKQMEAANVKRIIALGGVGLLDAVDGEAIFEQKDFPKEYLPLSLEHKKALNSLTKSSLDWTFVCPPMIENLPVTGLFHTSANVVPSPNNSKIRVGDLALFMLNELKNNEYSRMRVGISN